MKLDTLETLLIWDKNPRVLPLNFGLSLRRLTISSVGVVSVSQKPSLLCMETVFCLRLALHGREASQHWDSNWLQLKLSCLWAWAKLADHTELEQRSWVQRAAWCHSWEVTLLGKTQLSLVPPSLKLKRAGRLNPRNWGVLNPGLKTHIGNIRKEKLDMYEGNSDAFRDAAGL